jgi:hypothetical protein
MTQTTDLDRLLEDWLTDGPNRAPDQPINAATSFARAHPRRPDPLRIFRTDAMADRLRRPFGLSPAIVFALLALVAAIVAAGVVGSRPPQPSVVLPSSGPPSLSPAPSVSLSGSALAPYFAQFPLKVRGGVPLSFRVLDVTGDLLDATSVEPREGASVDYGQLVITPDPADENALIVTWTGMPCESYTGMSVDEGRRAIAVSRPICSGDTIALDRVVRLTFNGPVVAADWHGTIGDDPNPSDPGPS